MVRGRQAVSQPAFYIAIYHHMFPLSCILLVGQMAQKRKEIYQMNATDLTRQIPLNVKFGRPIMSE